MDRKPDPFLIDDDNPEWTDEQLARAVARKQGQRGAQKAPTKQLITLRLDADIIEKFKKTGDGWQSRINFALKQIEPV